MTEANATVQADSQAVGDVLALIVRTVLLGGGALHPGIRFVERAGDLCVHCIPAAGHADQPLIRLPRSLLVPLDGIEWAERDDELQIRSLPVPLTRLQQDLLDLHVALYNATRKLPWAVRNLPVLAAQKHADVLAAIRAIRPAFGRPPLPAAEALLGSRLVTYTPAPTPSNAAPARSRAILPLIELLNHHPQGAPYRADAGTVEVALMQPLGDVECFGRYDEIRDTLDIALHYGYADPYAPLAFGAPLECKVTGLGQLRIAAQPLARPLDPPRVTFDETGPVLSHLACDRQHPERLRAVVRLALLGAARRLGVSSADADRMVPDAFAAIRDANLALLNDLRASAGRLQSGMPVADLIGKAAMLQAGIIGHALTLPKAGHPEAGCS